MSMNMTAADLSGLAAQLEGLNKVQGISVTQFRYNGHDVYVEFVDGNQREGGYYRVIGITDKVKVNGALGGHKPGYRAA